MSTWARASAARARWGVCALALVFAGSSFGARSASPQFSLTQGFTFNNNITLLASDVNFGPAVLARDDITSSQRFDASYRRGHVRGYYQLSRAHFMNNGELDYFNQFFRTSYEVPGKERSSYYRLSLDYDKFSPDNKVQPDPVGGFPFTTTEIPNRRVYNVVLNQQIKNVHQVQLQYVDQSIWYENNPVIDNHANGGLVRYSRQMSKAFTSFAEAGTNTKIYQNIPGDFGDPAFLKTPLDHHGLGVSYIPSNRFGGVLKYNRVNQTANIEDFVLDQWDYSLILAYTPKRGPTTLLTTQASRRSFPLRLLDDFGTTQDDREWLANLQTSWRLARAVRGTVTLTYDRNRSNNTEFDYVNRIAALEVRYAF